MKHTTELTTIEVAAIIGGLLRIEHDTEAHPKKKELCKSLRTEISNIVSSELPKAKGEDF